MATRPLRLLRAPGRAEEVRGLVERTLRVAGRAGLPASAVEGLRTALAEALANALEHGGARDPGPGLEVRVGLAPGALVVDVVDPGEGGAGRVRHLPPPDARRQVAGEQPVGGWGLWLMRRSVDGVEVLDEAGAHLLRLIVRMDPS